MSTILTMRSSREFCLLLVWNQPWNYYIYLSNSTYNITVYYLSYFIRKLTKIDFSFKFFFHTGSRSNRIYISSFIWNSTPEKIKMYLAFEQYSELILFCRIFGCWVTNLMGIIIHDTRFPRMWKILKGRYMFFKVMKLDIFLYNLKKSWEIACCTQSNRWILKSLTISGNSSRKSNYQLRIRTSLLKYSRWVHDLRLCLYSVAIYYTKCIKIGNPYYSSGNYCHFSIQIFNWSRIAKIDLNSLKFYKFSGSSLENATTYCSNTL